MPNVRYEIETVRRDNAAASFTVWDSHADTGVARVIQWQNVDRMHEYIVNIRDIQTGRYTQYLGERYQLEPGQSVAICCECGGPCDAADAVADDSGLTWCGSFYGNGCADKVGS